MNISKLKIIALSTIAVVSVLIVATLYIKGQFFDDGNFLTTKTIKADAVYRIGAAGDDMRMYVVTVPEAPYMMCVEFAGTAKMDGDCFRKLDFDLDGYLQSKQLTNADVQKVQ